VRSGAFPRLPWWVAVGGFGSDANDRVVVNDERLLETSGIGRKMNEDMNLLEKMLAEQSLAPPSLEEMYTERIMDVSAISYPEPTFDG